MYSSAPGWARIAPLAERGKLAGRGLDHAVLVALGVLADLHAVAGGAHRSLDEHDIADEHADLLQVVALAAGGLVVERLVAVGALGGAAPVAASISAMKSGISRRIIGTRLPSRCGLASTVPRTFERNFTVPLDVVVVHADRA